MSSVSNFAIALPFGGNFAYLKKTVESVIGQTFKNWHMTILDDASQVKELKGYIDSLNDSRISLIQFNLKKGIVNIYEESKKYLNSEWNMILNADDILGSEFLRDISNIVENLDNVDIIQPNVKIIDKNGRRIQTSFDIVKALIRGRKSSRLLTSEAAIFKLSLGNWLYFPSLIWNRRLLIDLKFDGSLPVAFDFKLLVDLLLQDKTIYIAKEPVFFYRRHKSSNSMSDLNANLRSHEEREIFDFLSKSLKERRKYSLFIVAKLRLSNRLFVMYSILVNRKFLKSSFGIK